MRSMKKQAGKPRPFDPTGKSIIDRDPLGFVRWLGFTTSRVRVLNSDLSSRLQADRVILLVDQGVIVNIELQAQRDRGIRRRTLAYAGLLSLEFGLPVRTILILLRKGADPQRELRDATYDFDVLQWELRVVRIWEKSPEEFFTGSPAVLAFMPLSNVSKAQLPSFIGQAYDVIAKAYPRRVQKQFWGDTLVFVGLKHNKEFSDHLLEGVFKMLNLTTSSTYKGIFAEGEARGKVKGKAEGKAEGKEEILSLQLHRRFSTLSPAITQKLDALSPEQMDELGIALLDFRSLADLEDWLRSRE